MSCRSLSTRPRLRRAFTLIELLVVMGIMATLAALLNAGIAKSKASAHSTFCKNNLAQLSSGLQLFVSEFQRYPLNGPGKTSNAMTSDTNRIWTIQLTRSGASIPQPPTGFISESIWRCPSARWTVQMQRANPNHFSDYGYNDDKFSGAGPRDWQNKFGLQGHYSPTTDTYSPIAESEVVQPSDTIAIGDAFEPNGILMRRSIETYAASSNIRNRHRARANILFCDGHTESLSLQNLFEETTDAALRRWNRDHQPHSK
jgi:prepilin-type N-terminal cleavage/methylation domain-containing protein/prepilin-type processing-associated H-X9-DG protein